MNEPLSGPRLVVAAPDGLAGMILVLSRSEMLIGRGEAADFVLDDEFVSRRHALVTIDSSGAVTITDLDSASGTFVNDEQLTGPRVLKPGDTVRFADVKARFEPADPPEEPVEPLTEKISLVQAVPAPVATAQTSATSTVAVLAEAAREPAGSGGDGATGGNGAGTSSGDAYTVTGTVSSPVSPAVGGLIVELQDYNVGAEPTTLASTSTVGDGSYAFNDVIISTSYLQQHHKTSPDLQVQVRATATGAVLAASVVVYSAPAALSLNVVLPSTATGLASEYEQLTTDLTKVYPDSLAALKEDATRQDITYLANKTGWDARAVAMAAAATQFSQVTTPVPAPATPSTPTSTARAASMPESPGAQQNNTTPAVEVPPEFFYALFRAGLPTDADGLFRANSAQVQAIWQQAVTDNVIPQSAQSQIPAAVNGFETLAATHVLTAAPTVGVSTLQQVLAPTLTDATQQQQFALLYARYQGDWDSLWQAVGQAFGEDVTGRMLLAAQLNYLTINNAPLVAALSQSPTPPTSTLDLVTGGYYAADKWATLIGSAPVPSQIPGSTQTEQAAAYAQYLAAQVRLAHPTAVLADQVSNNVIPTTGTTPAADVADFLNTHQADFQVGAEPVDAYVARTGTSIDPDVRDQVKRLQRVYQLTPDDTSMAVLLRHNLDSAYALTRYDTAGFVRAFATKLGGEATATAVHQRAKQIFGSTLNVAVSYLKARTGVTVGGAATPFMSTYPPQAGPAQYPVPAYATLENLFGSMDYCSCSDCSSILSPAAYLVDLLNYLDQPAPTGGGDNPQDVLLARRPDLQYLPLTCPNTNTAMPYIDLVNETLEYFVSNGLSINGYQGHDTPDTITSAELIAAPQYIDDTAYALLQQAFFPPPLPFNRPLMLLRAHLQNLGIALSQAMTTLRMNEDFTNPATLTSYGWRDILIEQLTISRDEYRLFTDSTLELGDLYGLPNSTALATLQRMNLQDFSRRVNVSYVDLTAIIQTQFVNPNAPLIPRLQQLNATLATLQNVHDNQQGAVTSFINGLPAGLDFNQYQTVFNRGNPADGHTVVDWVNNAYPRIVDLIVIDNLSGDLGDCSGTNLALRYANPDANDDLLSSADLLKIIRFIRLWAKLAPLLGNPDDAVTIEQTDDIIAALYPSPLLLVKEPFATLLSRTGFAFDALNLLALTADQGMAQLLACWAPIQTNGPNALYTQLFLTPTLLQQDPGPQTATVATSVGVGDQLRTYINGVGGDSNTIPPYTVTLTDTAETVAANIAASINACMAFDAAWGNVALNSRFHATSQQNVITITAGVTIDCIGSFKATETYGPVTGTPVSRSVTVSGAPTAGDVLTTTIDCIAIPYTVVEGDTPDTIAANIATAVNTTTTPDAFGPPLNQLVYADADAGTINFVVMGAGAPFTLNCVDQPASSGTYTVAEPIPARYTATITGTVKAGDVFTTTINGVQLTYTSGSGETPTTVADSIQSDINGCVQLDAQTGQALNLEVHATGASGQISITPADPSDQLALECHSSESADPYTSAGPLPEQVVATLTGTIPPGATLTTTINDLPLVYHVAPGDEPAAQIAELVHTSSTIDPVTGLPPNKIVTVDVAEISSSASEYTLTFTAVSPTTPFTLGVSLVAGGYTAGQGRAPFADDGYGDYLNDPTQTLFAHEAALCAACNITAAEFAAITGDTPYALGYTPATPLTLDNVTEVFRRGWLAHTLGISVLEFLQLRAFTGVDPFTMPDAGDGPAAMIVFIELVQALSNAGIMPAQALYLVWNQDNAGTYTPPTSIITGLAAALIADFAAVDTEFALPPGGDPDGSIAKNLMTLVYGTAATDTFFGLLNNTFSTSVPYSVPPGQHALPGTVLAAGSGPGGQLSYNNIAKQLSFSGVLTSATQTAIDDAIVNTNDNTNVTAGPGVTFTPASMNNISQGTILVIDTGAAQETVTVIATTPTTFTADAANPHDGTAKAFPIANDPNLIAGIAALTTANQQAVNQFFATYPELQSLYTTYVASTQPVQDKRTTLLQGFLPILKAARKGEQALATAASTAGVDPSFATALLQDPAILHTDTDPTAAAVNDLINIENQGLTAQFYLNNTISGTPDQTIDPQPPESTGTPQRPLSYAQTANIGGTVTAGDVLHTTINGVDMAYTVQQTDTTATVLAASIAAAINSCTQLVPTSAGGNLPINQIVTASSDGATITLAGSDPSGTTAVFTIQTSATSTTSAAATETYLPGNQFPPGGGPAGIAAVWSGYLTVSQNGFYDINIATDDGADITLQIDGTSIPGAMSGTLWSNTGPIALTSGSLIAVTIAATSIKTTFAVSWTSQGQGWQPIPIANLYPLDLVTRLGNTYTRFLKAVTLASALSLTADEIAYLGTATGYAVDTTSTSSVTPGNAIFAPASMTNITVGSQLLIDSGANLETVTVTAVSATTFTATAAKAHDGSTPFTVISQSSPTIGQGWINFLIPQGIPDQTTAASLAGVLTALLDFARIKQALSPNDERLLNVLTDPTGAIAGQPGQTALLSLTGWSQASLNALLTHFFSDAGQFPTATTAPVLSSVENFRRIYDAYSLVTASGLSAANLISAITNAPTPTTVAALQSALRAQYAQSDWLTVIGPINDSARIQQRDALVAYIVQQLGDAYEATLITMTTAAATTTGATTLKLAHTAGLSAGMPVSAGTYVASGTTIAAVTNSTTITLSTGALAAIPIDTAITFAPADAIPIVDADTLYDLLLVDTQTQPPVLTSRIRLALSIEQLFIERIIRNLEPQCAAADIDTAQWAWMKTYRMWQANREVFLWPENWADPQLRDNQSPLFEQMMTALQQGDITDDAATTGYLTYLTGLEEIAKLEPCGIYYLPGNADTDETTYVVARTAGGRRKYYSRELTGGSWTPWSEVNIECEDNPLTPVVWNGRLFLFWLKVIKHSAPQGKPSLSANPSQHDLSNLKVDDLEKSATASPQLSGAKTVTASAILCWTEYYNGAWQPTKTSDPNAPTVLTSVLQNWGRGIGDTTPISYDASGSNSFEVQRGLLRLVPIQFPSPNTYDVLVGLANPSSEPGSSTVFPADSVLIAITNPTDWVIGGFMLHNTHSLPIRLDDIVDPLLGSPLAETLTFVYTCLKDGFVQPEGYGPLRFLPTAQPYTGAATSEAPFTITYGASPPDYRINVLDYSSMPRWVDTQPLLPDNWDAPFMYEDRRSQFYVITTTNVGTSAAAKSAARTTETTVNIPPLILARQPAAAGANNNAAAVVTKSLAAGSTINTAVSTQAPVTYQGRVITAAGSADDVTAAHAIAQSES